MEIASQVGEMRSRLAAETAERAQLITALLPAAEDAATYDLLATYVVLQIFKILVHFCATCLCARMVSIFGVN